MHRHGPTRAERVCSGVFWGKAESGRSHPEALGSVDGDDVGSADGAEAMIGGIIADGGGRSTPSVAEAEEDVASGPDRAGCGRLGAEVRDGLAVDGILLIVEGEDNLSCPAEMLSGSVRGEEKVPDKEHEVHEGSELDCQAVAGALRVFTGPEAEVEANDDQVGNMVGSGVGGGSFLGDNELDSPEGDCLFSSDQEFTNV